MLFISGVFDEVPSDSMMGTIAAVFPVRHLLQATLDVYAGEPFPWLAMLVVVTWGAVGGVIAVRRYRWAPS